MKTFGTILLYLGITLLVIATYFSAKYALAFITAPAGIWTDPPFENWAPYQYLLFDAAAAIPGTIVTLFGLLIVRPRNVWMALLVVGTAYCLSTLIFTVYPSLKGTNKLDSIWAFLFLLLLLLPGILYIIEAILLRKLEIKPNK